MTTARAHSTRARRTMTLLVAFACAAASLSLASPAQSAPVVNHDRVVSAVPGTTPAINDGEVDAIVQVGDTMVVGGTFTSVTPVGGAATTRNYLMAFNVSTGALVSTFAPALNGSVNELVAGPTAGTVYVGGVFTKLGTVGTSHVALLDTTTGATVTGFKAPTINGVVYSMVKRGSRLIVGGSFTTVGAVAHGGIATLNATNGALDPWMNAQVSGHHNNSGTGSQGPVGVRDMDVTADGSRLVIIGNFKMVNGVLRDQIAMMSLTDATSTLTADWATTRYSPYCFNWAFDTYVRGVSFSPNGAYFVVTATGGYNAGTLCDAAARFETNATGTAIQPSWVDYTGGDTLWAVTVTEQAVYVGGHQRWLNNSLASDRAGAGAVPRPGIAALNTTTGVPLAWNPGRNPRGAAVYALYATPAGLWMGSDTEYIGNHRYKRPRIAFFPLVSGSPEASDNIASLPGTAFLGGNQTPVTSTTNDLRAVSLTSAGARPASAWADGGVVWSGVRGSFVAGDKLYYGKSDNTFNSRTYNANGAFGPETKIDPYNDPTWAGVDTGSKNTYDGKQTTVYTQFSTINGMAYSAGKLYYTRTGDSNLYWRWFNTDSGIIGADQFTASGGRNWNATLGMFASDGKLYFVTKADGNLNAVPLTSTGPSGVTTVVNGPATGGTDWRARALFLLPGNVVAANVAPTAAYTQSCTELACTFDATGSTDSDGSVSSYDWDFGDTTSGSGAVVQHTFTGSGDYQVKLTVTDNAGATATKTVAVTVLSAVQTNPITFVDSATRSMNVAAPAVTIPTTVQEGDTLLLTGTLSSATTASAPADWTLVGDQTATSSLRSVVWVKQATATDAGSSVTVTMDAVHKSTLALGVYRGVNAANPVVSATASTDASTSTHTTPSVTVPGGSWVVSLWSDKSANTQWTTPGTVSLRAQAYSSSTGAVSEAMADSNGPVAGVVPGTTATSNALSARGVNWTIVLGGQ